ncbi:MAG: hypothetical protein INR81_24625 [Microcystis aeruginosa PMC 728.11]|nr:MULTISPECIES: hypothetical protein [unclassified Microcystis]MBE5232110.1 hypothetical protein [Microcystis aeruginosa PMC 728.11]
MALDKNEDIAKKSLRLLNIIHKRAALCGAAAGEKRNLDAQALDSS